MDKLTPQQRSENMRRIRSKGMEPELEVRRLVHRLGYRFCLHDKNLPGSLTVTVILGAQGRGPCSGRVWVSSSEYLILAFE